MFRTLSLLALRASADASIDDTSCAVGEVASLLQMEMPNSRNEESLLRVNVTENASATAAIAVDADAAVADAVHATEEWHFPDIDLGDLLSSFDPDKLKDRFSQILDDHDLSLDDLSKKLTDFTTKFQDRLNQTVTQTQDRLKDMKDQVKTKGKKLKSRVLLETSDKVTKLGDAAVSMAQKVTGKVDEARGRVQTLLTSLKSEQVKEAKEAIRTTLDTAANALSTLVDSLKQAMHFQLPTSLLSLTDDPDLVDQTLSKTEQVLNQADEALQEAQTYVDYVNKTIADTKAKAQALMDHLSEQGDDSIAAGDAMADALIDKLGDINDVLGGKLSLDEVKTRLNEKSSSPRAASLCFGLALLLSLLS